MFSWPDTLLLAVALLVTTAAGAHAGTAERPIGRVVTPADIARWDIDVRPDGQGLPPGQGTAADGEAIFLERCASCHGEFGEGVGRWPVLIGGRGSLASENPVKTPASYWPYATILFDYIYRTMPFGDAQSLPADAVYALTAYLLAADDVIPAVIVLDARTLPQVVMPNAGGFIPDPRPDVPAGEPCMRDCAATVEITSRATTLDVTPAADRKGTEVE